MVRKAAVVVAMAVALSAMIFVPAWGGGWAVVTLDSLPGDPGAGEPYEIGFTVRQHGVTLLAGLQPKPTIQAIHAETNRQVLAEAVDSGSVGHYVVTLTLPDTGTWNWGINGFGELQPMPVLQVLEGSGAPAAPPRAGVPWALWGSAITAAAGLALGFRRKF